MSKAAFIERDGAFWPMDADGREIIASTKGKRCMVNVHVPRNLRHHRLFFYLVQKLLDGGAWHGTKESFEDYIKIATHHVRTVIEPGSGKVYFIPDSIDFASMDQPKFRRFFDRAIYVVCERLVPGQNWEALRDEIIEAVDGDAQRRAA